MVESAGDGDGSPTGVKPDETPFPASPRKATLGDLLAELKRRRVFRVMVGYAISAFALLQVVEPIMHGADLPAWVLKAVLVALAVGLPVALVLAWLFDLTAQGVRRTPSAPGPGATSFSRKRLAALLIAVALLGALPGVAWYLWRKSGERGHGAAAAGAPPSIAVLPFADMSPGKDQEYFADGMAEEVLDKLAHIRGLKVIGRTSSFSFKGKGDDLRVIGQKLGVGHVLEGSVRKSGTRVRITAQLIETAGGSHLWSETFERDLHDVFAVQGEISRAVVDALRVNLLPGQAPRPGEYRPASPEAYQSYLLGKHFSNGFSRDSQQRAVAALQKAVELDPAYPPAWAALARSWLLAGTFGAIPWADARREALAAASRAVALAPDLPDALAARARARLVEWDWAGARADVNRAVELGPEDPPAISAMTNYLYWTGRHSEQVPWFLRLLEKEPLDGGAWNGLGVAYWFTGQSGEADRAFARAIEVDPQNAFAPDNRAVALVDAGRAAEGLALCMNAGGPSRCRAIAYHALGNTGESQRELDALLAQEPKPKGDRPFLIAEVYAFRGQREQAFEWLDRAVAEHARILNGLQGHPHFRSLRTDPRYVAILRKMNLPVD